MKVDVRVLGSGCSRRFLNRLNISDWASSFLPLILRPLVVGVTSSANAATLRHGNNQSHISEMLPHPNVGMNHFGSVFEGCLMISNHLQGWLDLVEITAEIGNIMMVDGTTSRQVLFRLRPAGVFTCLRLKPLSAAELLQPNKTLHEQRGRLTNVPTHKRLTPAFWQDSSRGHSTGCKRTQKKNFLSTQESFPLTRQNSNISSILESSVLFKITKNTLNQVCFRGVVTIWLTSRDLSIKQEIFRLKFRF